MVASFADNYYFLSNYYPCIVMYDGITYQNSEAAFQAQKCTDREKRKIFASLNAASAKKLGREVTLRPDWESQKVRIMREVVDAKFTQNENLRIKLLATGDEYLQEGNTWGDRIWGTVSGKGANLLGTILMELREKYREQERDGLHDLTEVRDEYENRSVKYAESEENETTSIEKPTLQQKLKR